MTLSLTPEDRVVIDRMRQRRKKPPVLQSLKGHRLNQSDGIILVSCGDCDQFADIFEQKIRMQKDQRLDTRIHPITPNGGPIRLVHDSPANKPGRTYDLDLMDDILFVARKKVVRTVALVIHLPCGHAAEHSLAFFQMLRLLIQAKHQLKTEGAPYIQRVACFLHVDYQDEKGKRTYFVSRTELIKMFPREFHAYLAEPSTMDAADSSNLLTFVVTTPSS